MRLSKRGRPRKGSIRRETCVKSIRIDKDTDDCVEKHARWGVCSGNTFIIRAINNYIKENYPAMYEELHPRAQRTELSKIVQDSPQPKSKGIRIVHASGRKYQSEEKTMSDDEYDIDVRDDEEEITPRKPCDTDRSFERYASEEEYWDEEEEDGDFDDNIDYFLGFTGHYNVENDDDDD